MLKILPRLREAQKIAQEKSLLHKPSYEAQIGELYKPKYDLTVPVILHQRQVRFDRNRPYISPVLTYVAQSSVLVGDIEVGEMTVILPNSVIRAEFSRSAIGDHVFIAENNLIVQSPLPLSSTHDGSFMIGDGAAIGPNCILRGCTIEPHSFVGEGCQVLDGATVETCSILLPGSVLPEGAVVKEDEIWGGAPARFIRKITEEEQEKMYAWVMDQYQVFNQLRVDSAEPQTMTRYFLRYWENVLRAALGEHSRYDRPRFNYNGARVYFTDAVGEADGTPPPKSRNPFSKYMEKFE
eukprot:TRINITY_DN3424_c0_g1_i1.p1 TRINITY_DN3424_c0_g1~~TRINITY_DN3424_c0_g1_i1.p1  ORF type:complete len:295 (+),score=43.56 TRINITY_DN3424_c0_g1_i1:72-956(+)